MTNLTGCVVLTVTFCFCLRGQFIIEAVLGGNQGSIAIDDIVVYRSESDSCPAERECTFQSSLCGLLPEPSTSETWARMTGMSKPTSSSGPTVDHTLGTDQGVHVVFQFQLQSVISTLEPSQPLVSEFHISLIQRFLLSKCFFPEFAFQLLMWLRSYAQVII